MEGGLAPRTDAHSWLAHWEQRSWSLPDATSRRLAASRRARGSRRPAARKPPPARRSPAHRRHRYDRGLTGRPRAERPVPAWSL